jgi:hypothetical protein
MIACSLYHHDKLAGLEQGVRRVGEVLLGCGMDIAVACLLSRVWPLPEHLDTRADDNAGAS